MRSRRDQLQAYQFLRRRIVAALLSGEPESPEAPMRRIVRTAFAGTMIAALIAAGFGVFGVIKKGGATSWQRADTIVREKEGSALYVWVAPNEGAPRRLHPMVNFTSARLFLGSGVTKSVSRQSLAGIPRAPQKGILDAPSSVPEPKELIRGPWSVCAGQRNGKPEVSLLAGVSPVGTPLGPEAAVLVTDSARRRTYVVWKGQRFAAPDPKVVRALGFNDSPAQVVGDAWVSALPQGRDLTFPAVPGRGQAAPDVDGQPTVVGQVFKVSGLAKVQYAVAVSDGLAQISEGVAQLLEADPAGGALAARTLSSRAFTDAKRASSAPAGFAGYPDRQLEQPAGSESQILCTKVSGSADAGSTPAVYAVGALPSGAQVINLRGKPSGGRALADQAYLPAGGAALVRGTGGNKTRYFISDVGKKFPIGDDEALGALGYEAAPVAVVPAEFLDLLPNGPSLSRAAAAKPTD